MLWLSRGGLKVILSDKDGVFVVLRESVLNQLREAGMSRVYYKMLPRDFLSYNLHRIRTTSFLLCDRLRALGHGRWAWEASKAVEVAKPRDFVSKLGCTIKTHKPAGEIALGLIHSSVGHGLRGLSAVLHRLCGEVLKTIPFLAVNSVHVVGLFRGPSCRRMLHSLSST